MTEEKQIFNRDEMVPKEGNYVCVPCGYHHHFKEGEHFTECTSCFAGGKEGADEFAEGLEMWEPASESAPDDASGPAASA